MEPNAYLAAELTANWPAAIALIKKGDIKAGMHAYLHSGSYYSVPYLDEKVHYYASALQAAVTKSKAAKEHEAITDELCHRYNKLNCANKEMVDEICRRREEWRTLFGVYSMHKRLREKAIFGKKFWRKLRVAGLVS